MKDDVFVLELERQSDGDFLPVVGGGALEHVEGKATVAGVHLLSGGRGGCALNNFHLVVGVVPAEEVEVEVDVEAFVEGEAEAGLDGEAEGVDLDGEGVRCDAGGRGYFSGNRVTLHRNALGRPDVEELGLGEEGPAFPLHDVEVHVGANLVVDAVAKVEGGSRDMTVRVAEGETRAPAVAELVATEDFDAVAGGLVGEVAGNLFLVVREATSTTR